MLPAAAMMMVGGGLLSAYGQLQQGQAAYRAARFNAESSMQNATLSRAQAAEDAKRFKLTIKRQMGDMRANIGASGLTLDGSALDVLEDSAAQADLDARTIVHQGELKAYGFERDAQMQMAQGNSAVRGSYYGAAASILSAGGNVAKTYG